MTIVTSVDFSAKPTRNKVKVALAGGLTAQTAAQKVRVTVDGEPVPHFQCLVENGNLKVRFASGMVIYRTFRPCSSRTPRLKRSRA